MGVGSWELRVGSWELGFLPDWVVVEMDDRDWIWRDSSQTGAGGVVSTFDFDFTSET
jgi:hypothetical protein